MMTSTSQSLFQTTNGRRWRRPLAVTGTVAALAACSTIAACSSSSPTSAEPSASSAKGAVTIPATGSSGAPASARFEPAFAQAPAGSSCTLRPEGDTDPRHALQISVDADGVARFQAVRPGQPGSVERLSLECTSPRGDATSVPVDLLSATTFAAHPFDTSGLELRPALEGDPRSYTQSELLRAGYGLRPDPDQDPNAYAGWLAAASVPAHWVRDATGSAPAATIQTPPRRGPVQAAATREVVSTVSAGLSTGQGAPWTGAELRGQYHLGATAAQTTAYAANQVVFNVPVQSPNAILGSTQISLWNGLDDVFQAIVWAYTTPTTASYSISRQIFLGVNGNVTGPYSPNANDTMFIEEWYCDAGLNPNMFGGYACTRIHDLTQGLMWDCLPPGNGTTCIAWSLTAADLANGALGHQADFVVEMDSAENQSVNDNNWPIFAPFTMNGNALVVQGGTNQVTWTNVATDPNVLRLIDWTTNVPSHVNVNVSGPSVVWSMSNWSATVPYPSEVTVAQSGLCLDVEGGVLEPYTLVDMTRCAGNPSQLWTMSADPGQAASLSVAGTNLCLTNVANQGSKLEIQTCDGSPNQVWTVNVQSIYGGDVNAGSEVTQDGLCLNVIGGSTAPGTPLTIWPCQDLPNSFFESTNEVWTFTAQLQIMSVASDTCLNVAEDVTSPGGSVILWPCVGTPNMLWSLDSGGNLREAQSGLCLTASTQGGPVTIESCSGPGWTHNSQDNLVNNQTGECLDSSTGSLTMAPCTGVTGQIWFQQ